MSNYFGAECKKKYLDRNKATRRVFLSKIKLNYATTKKNMSSHTV